MPQFMSQKYQKTTHPLKSYVFYTPHAFLYAEKGEASLSSLLISLSVCESVSVMFISVVNGIVVLL